MPPVDPQKDEVLPRVPRRGPTLQRHARHNTSNGQACRLVNPLVRTGGAFAEEEDGWVTGGTRDHRAISTANRGACCRSDLRAGRPGGRHLRRGMSEHRGREHEHMPSWNRRCPVLDPIHREGGLRLRTGQTDVPLRLRRSAARTHCRARRHAERHVIPARNLQVLRGDARANGRPRALRRKGNTEAVHAQDSAAALGHIVSCCRASVGSRSAFSARSYEPEEVRASSRGRSPRVESPRGSGSLPTGLYREHRAQAGLPLHDAGNRHGGSDGCTEGRVRDSPKAARA